MNRTCIAACWCGMSFTVTAPERAVAKLLRSMTRPHEQRCREGAVIASFSVPTTRKGVTLQQRRRTT